jgi:uncharacterized protein (DUF1697 family)
VAHVVLLRGVNVGGQRTFRPSVLAKELQELDVVNVGAAGTFVVRAPITASHLRDEFRRRLPFDAEILIAPGRDFLRITSSNPFEDGPAGPDIVRFVTVLAKRPSALPTLPMNFPPSGKWLLRIVDIQDRFLFGMYRRHLKAIGYLGAIDKMFDMPVTTRNWNTINAIVKAL